MIAEETPADAPDHWAVPAHEGLKGGFVPPLDEAGQQMRVRHARGVGQKDSTPKMLATRAPGTGPHEDPPWLASCGRYLLFPD